MTVQLPSQLASFPDSLSPRKTGTCYHKASKPPQRFGLASPSSRIWACVAKLKDLGLRRQAQGFGLASPSLRIWACVAKLKDLGLRRQAQGFGLASPSSRIWTCVAKLKDLGLRRQAQGLGLCRLVLSSVSYMYVPRVHDDVIFLFQYIIMHSWCTHIGLRTCLLSNRTDDLI